MDWPTSALGIVVILCFTYVWLALHDAKMRKDAFAALVTLKQPQTPPSPPPASTCDCAGCTAVRSAELGEDA